MFYPNFDVDIFQSRAVPRRWRATLPPPTHCLFGALPHSFLIPPTTLPQTLYPSSINSPGTHSRFSPSQSSVGGYFSLLSFRLVPVLHATSCSPSTFPLQSMRVSLCILVFISYNHIPRGTTRPHSHPPGMYLLPRPRVLCTILTLYVGCFE